MKNAVEGVPDTDDDIKNVEPAVNASLLRANEAILPPVNNTCEPVISPLPLTLNLDDDIKNPVPLLPGDPLMKNPEPVSAFCVITKPPIAPAVAVTVPVILTDPLNKADDAVTLPFALTLKLDAEMKKLSPVAEPEIKKLVPVKAFPLSVNPPILPPSSSTLDPVICPLLLSTN